MGHHSHLDIAGHTFFHCRDGYLPELAALFTESDRRVVDHGDEGTEFVYATTVASLRERLQVQGFTADRCRLDLEQALKVWSHKQPPADQAGSAPHAPEGAGRADQRLAARSKTVREWSQGPALIEWTASIPGVEEIEDAIRRRLARHWDELSLDDMLAFSDPGPLDPLSWYMDSRSFARLLVEFARDPCAEVCLNLSELTGCCVELAPDLPVAGDARAEQLADLAQNAPLLVITEGITDARLLSAGMEITHPHLTGFVSFFDHAGSGAEGGVAALAKTVSAFVAAGVANRFVALADNDTESHAGLKKLKQQPLPDRCRVIHYPPLPLLDAYPTMGPTSELPILQNVNGLAGSVEMYLGRDILELASGQLMPVQWRSWNPNLPPVSGHLV